MNSILEPEQDEQPFYQKALIAAAGWAALGVGFYLLHYTLTPSKPEPKSGLEVRLEQQYSR